MTLSVFNYARQVLLSKTADDKLAACEELANYWEQSGETALNIDQPLDIPDNPARPVKPQLVHPKDLPRRRLGSEAGRIALLHSIAHIEFNAIDLAADMIARFGAMWDEDVAIQKEFVADWLSVLTDEARHFSLIRSRLDDFDTEYGDLPAHNGLWEAAMRTSGDIAARLAIAPMVLEARGLDVTPKLIEKSKNFGDFKSADLLQIIYDEEIDHVAIGVKWFKRVANLRKIKAEILFKSCIDRFFKGELKPPFNHAARNKAGLTLEYYT